MQRTKKIPVGDKEITAAELSVAQIRNLLDQMETMEISVFDMLFPDGVPSIAVAESTGISLKQLEQYLPSELKLIIDGVESLNPFFVNMMTRLAKAGEQMISEKTSTKPAAG